MLGVPRAFASRLAVRMPDPALPGTEVFVYSRIAQRATWASEPITGPL